MGPVRGRPAESLGRHRQCEWQLEFTLAAFATERWQLGFTLVALTNTDLRSGPAGVGGRRFCVPSSCGGEGTCLLFGTRWPTRIVWGTCLLFGTRWPTRIVYNPLRNLSAQPPPAPPTRCLLPAVFERRRKEEEASARKERNAGTKHQNANNNLYGCGKTPPPLVKPNPSLSDSDRPGFVLGKSWTGFACPGRAQRVGGAPPPQYPAKLTSSF